MALTYQAAVEQLTNGINNGTINSIADLKSLVNQIDASVGDSTLLLYSGTSDDLDLWKAAENLSDMSDTGNGKAIKTIPHVFS